MDDLQKLIAELLTKAAEVELIAGLPSDAKARTYNEHLLEELQKAIQQLQRQIPDRLFLLQLAEKCRHLVTAVTDQHMMVDLQKLAAAFEETCRRNWKCAWGSIRGTRSNGRMGMSA